MKPEELLKEIKSQLKRNPFTEEGVRNTRIFETDDLVNAAYVDLWPIVKDKTTLEAKKEIRRVIRAKGFNKYRMPYSPVRLAHYINQEIFAPNYYQEFSNEELSVIITEEAATRLSMLVNLSNL